MRFSEAELKRQNYLTVFAVDERQYGLVCLESVPVMRDKVNWHPRKALGH